MLDGCRKAALGIDKMQNTELLEQKKTAYDLLIKLLIDFGRKNISLQPITHIKYKFRESLLYRLDSIIFH